ncbi:MAG: hypothetical protein KY469_08040 [Actinobacteria bacterium]|nr:hypothetical protein [Actinomycetota bacterium]
MSRATLRRVSVAAVVVMVAAVTILLVRSDSSPPPAPAPSPTRAAETLEEQLERVARTVAELRELPFNDLPAPTFLTPEELAEEAAAVVEDYTLADADIDARVLSLLGAIEPGTDLRELLSVALAEQVAGFYDPEDGRLVVGTRDASRRLGPLDELVLAHELEHALMDQVIGLPDLEVEAGDEDRAFAHQALIEGDATVLMEEYATVAFSFIDQLRLAGESFALAGQLENLTEMPHVIQRTLLMPYEEGAVFVRTLLDQGGWAAVDDAYRSPPDTTADILYPERYLSGEEHVAPRPVPAPGGAWVHGATMGFGAADLLLLFEAPAGEPDRALEVPRERAAAWNGGTLALFLQGEVSSVGIGLADRGGLCLSVTAWYEAAFPEATASVDSDGTAVFDGATQDAVVHCPPDEVRVGIAPDLGTARTLAG